MRLRKVKGAAETIAAHPEIVIPNGEALKGKTGNQSLKKINLYILKLEWEKGNSLLEWHKKIPI